MDSSYRPQGGIGVVFMGYMELELCLFKIKVTPLLHNTPRSSTFTLIPRTFSPIGVRIIITN